jgi:hypothetical protein
MQKERQKVIQKDRQIDISKKQTDAERKVERHA